MEGRTKFSVIAIAAVVAIMAALSAYSGSLSPVSASPVYIQNFTPSNTTQPKAFPNFQRGNPMGPQMNQWQKPNINVGQTVTITSTQGRFRVFGSGGTNGTASGTLTFTVTGKLMQGYTLSITKGSFTVAETTYNIASGSAQMGLFAQAITGQGTTNPTGQFMLRAQAHGDFSGTSSAVVSLDFSNGTTEYAITLTGSIQG